ncbi:ATP-binding protein [Streptomyces rubrogriseus]|uniref:ATP-binding protein n=1 Tax=Streptomyces rubrogriseus TaxID=194673 RepID=UPI0035653EDE
MRCARGGPGDQAATGAAPTELFGRREETAVLDGLLTQARGGSGGALVVWGEPGIGKSALLRHVHGQAAGFVRLSHSATRPESDLAFAGLHGLLRPLADRVELLATAQAAAVRTALGLSGEPTDRLVVGAAVLSLLRGLAERQPVLVVVDDGQWLDEATALCLGFVARRVGAHPVVVVLADHSDPAARPWEGVADVRVDGLSDESAQQLVAAVAPLTDEATRRRGDEATRRRGDEATRRRGDEAEHGPGGRGATPWRCTNWPRSGATSTTPSIAGSEDDRPSGRACSGLSVPGSRP